MNPNRYTILALLAFFYLMPILLISSHSVGWIGFSSSWLLFSTGLLLAFIGLTVLFLAMCRWASQLEPEIIEVPTPVFNTVPDEKSKQLETTLAEYQAKELQLVDEIKHKNEDLQRIYQDLDKHQKHLENAFKELETFKEASQEQLKQRDQYINESQQMISEYRQMIERQQEKIAELEAKEQELNYEIKTLLQVTSLDDYHSLIEDEDHSIDAEDPISEIPAPPYPIEIPEDQQAKLLNECLDIAGRMNGVGNSSRLKDLSVENYVLDLRRLSDSLKFDTPYLILLYSQKESRLLFANQQAKTLLGWPAEKMVQIFPEIIQSGAQRWSEGLSQLSSKQEYRTHIPFKNRDGQYVTLNCCLGLISTGLFRNYVIAVLSHDAN